MIILKKTLSVLIAVTMLMSVMSISAFAETTELTAVEKNIIKMQRVDADGDGTYTTGDVSAVLKAAAGIAEEDDYEKYDINGDGFVSVRDAQATLKAVTGVEPVVSQAELLAIYNERINSVKGDLPGFTKREIIQCTNVLVTTKNAPYDAFNVTNLEFNEYVAHLETEMSKPPLSWILGSQKDTMLNELRAAAQNIYKPQSRSVAVGRGEEYKNDHTDLFVVSGLNWSSNLTTSDIKGISYTMSGGRFVITITMKEYTYVGDKYPTGVAGLSARTKLPYGKAFNLPEFDESDGSVVNSVTLKDGEITFSMDYKTSDVLKSVYNYTYISDIKSPPDKDSELEMITKTTADSTETYVVNRVTV